MSTKAKGVKYSVEKDEVEIAARLSEPLQPNPYGGTNNPRPLTDHPTRFNRQQSGGVKAKHHWKIVRKHIEETTQNRGSTREKWANLTRSVSHGVADFFTLDADNKATNNVLSSEMWKARYQRLHTRSILLRNKKQQQLQDSMISKSFERIDEEEDDDIDIKLCCEDNRWVCRTSNQSTRSFTSSRQVSRMSTGSGKRLTRQHPTMRLNKDSVFKMAMNGIINLTKGTTSVSGQAHRSDSIIRSRSIAPATFVNTTQRAQEAEEYVDGVFFNEACPTSPLPRPSALPQANEDIGFDGASADNLSTYDTIDGNLKPRGLGVIGKDSEIIPAEYLQQPKLPDYYLRGPDDDILRSKLPDSWDSSKFSPPRAMKRDEGRLGDLYMKRAPKEVIDAVNVNTDRRQFGIGAVGTLLGTDYRRSQINSEVLGQMSQLQDYRPFFTYWVTFVQIVIFIFTIAVYRITYLSETDIKEEVRTITLAQEMVSYTEQGNMWLGPRQADLIHLGAKYSPCMRSDVNVKKVLEEDRVKWKRSGCCIYNDGSGCAQMNENKCPKTLASWNMTVCGQDPEYCKNPNQFQFPWPKDDFTKWPICTENRKIPVKDTVKHMTCEVVARPCCVGIHGRCIITTPDYCKYRRGYFHPEATLCSQVESCLSEICGMLPFLEPNQFYRLWTSLFLHAGLLQLAITVVLQILIMRDIEKLLGWFRLGIIYIFSGIAGSLASAIFLPYHVEAGPSGSQFAILACLFVEVIQNWKILDQPCLAVFKLALIFVVLFIVGLFPWVDNYAHLFGFAFGFLLSFALMPYVDFSILGRKGRIVSVIVCLTLVGVIFAIQIVLFYVTQIEHCPYCHYINCIPFTKSFCKSMEVVIENTEL